MKILYTIDGRLDGRGAPRSTFILAEMMARTNDVYVVKPWTGENDTANIHCIQLKKFNGKFPFIFQNPIKSLLLVYEIYRAIKKLSPDIIHAEMPRSARALGLLKKIGLIKTPIIYTEREYVTGLRKIYQWLYSILVAKPFDRIICLSNMAVPFWLKYRKGGVVVIPNPGGGEFDVYSEEAKSAAEKAIEGYDSRHLNVLFVGRFIKTKRWEMIEDIINQYSLKKSESTHFYIAMAFGKDDNEAKAMVNRLKKIRNATVYPNASVETISSLNYICDLHLITSSIESFGRTAIEAMARKCVVYSTNAGAISETIGSKEYILPADTSAFLDVIETYEDKKEQLNEVKEKMYKRYQDYYSTKAHYQATMNLYEDLLQCSEKK